MVTLLSKLEACEVLIAGGNIEYSPDGGHRWVDLSVRSFAPSSTLFNPDCDYLFRKTPNYCYTQIEPTEAMALCLFGSTEEYYVKHPDLGYVLDGVFKTLDLNRFKTKYVIYTKNIEE